MQVIPVQKVEKKQIFSTVAHGYPQLSAVYPQLFAKNTGYETVY
jgi:hypothetical protein